VGLIATAEVISALSQTATSAPLQAAVGDSGLFLIFAAIVLAALAYAVLLMPETKGINDHEMLRTALSRLALPEMTFYMSLT